MGRTVEISGESLIYLFYATALVGCVVLLIALLWSAAQGSFANLAAAALIGTLLLGWGVAVWRRQTGREREQPEPEEGITWDPIAYPRHMAKHNWLKAVRRLPSEDDEKD